MGSLPQILGKKVCRGAWLTAQTAMATLAVDPKLSEKRLDLLASVDAELDQVAKKTLTGQTCVVREGFPGAVEQGLDFLAGEALSHLFMVP